MHGAVTQHSPCTVLKIQVINKVHEVAGTQRAFTVCMADCQSTVVLNVCLCIQQVCLDQRRGCLSSDSWRLIQNTEALKPSIQK